MLAVMAFAGCVPYAAPPVTGDLGASRFTTPGASTGLHADLGVAPFQVVRTGIDRNWDATLSASIDRSGGSTAWGAAAAGGPVFHPWGMFDDEIANRLLVQGVARWTQDGYGAGARVAVETTRFVAGTAADGNGAAGGFGELAIGLYVETARWSLEGTPSWNVTAGLTLRTPLIAGVSCCIF